MNLPIKIINLAKETKKASSRLSLISTEIKNKALLCMAKSLEENSEFIIKENEKDLIDTKKKKLSSSLIDRLTLNKERIGKMSTCLKELVKLPDPVGVVINAWKRPNGLIISKVRSPIGVIGIIYESRPDVTSDCIGLCLKSGNAVILRGGSEAINSNIAIYKTLKASIKNLPIPQDSFNLIDVTSHKAVDILLKQDKFVDLIIPRGGEALIQEVSKKSRIPVIKHYKGICIIYVDDDADLNMAEKICFNAKVQRPGVCNAMETLLVHKDVAIRFLPGMIKKFKEANVQIRACPFTKRIVPQIKSATKKDWVTEFLDLILAVRVVDNLDKAIEHINQFGSHHSDTIVTDNFKNAEEFLKRVDSACVYVNASTRFSDGYQFGLGSEIGISTDKLHARGPMALEELTTYKYTIFGDGQVRE